MIIRLTWKSPDPNFCEEDGHDSIVEFGAPRFKRELTTIISPIYSNLSSAIIIGKAGDIATKCCLVLYIRHKGTR
jgi:hypothetical protein